ncbi:MAG TPA: hypothetical protein VIY48_13640 [Candidatus Paceibacterota bacterium]
MSTFDKPVRKTIHLYRGTRIDDWSDIKLVVVEDFPDYDMEQLIREANARKIELKAATKEIEKYHSVMFTGA